MARTRLAAQAEGRDVLATVAGAGEDRLALGIGEGPLGITLDRTDPRMTTERDKAGTKSSDSGEELFALDHPAVGLCAPATFQAPSTFCIERSSIIATCSVFTGSVTPPTIWPSQ